VLERAASPQAAVRELLGDPPLWWNCCSEAVRTDPAWLSGPLCEELHIWLNATAPDQGAASVASVDHPLSLARVLAAFERGTGEHDVTLLGLTAAWEGSGLLCSDAAPGPAQPSGKGLDNLSPRLAGALSAVLDRIRHLRACAAPSEPSPSVESLLTIAVLMMAGLEPRRRPAVRVSVVFGRSAGPDGQADLPQGVTGVLELREFPPGPAGLYPDPRAMAGVRSPNGQFAAALGHAWRLAGPRREGRCVLWRIVLSDEPAAPARLEGPSLGAAFALGLRELLRHPPSGRVGTTRLRGVFYGLRPRTAVTGALDGGEHLLWVSDMDAKLLAARRKGLRLVAPEANRLDAAKAPEPGDVRFARTLRQADRHARRLRTGRIVVTLSLVAVSGAGAGAAAVAVNQHRNSVRQHQDALSRQLAAQAAALDTSQPDISKQMRIAAYRTAPTAEAFDALTTGVPLPGVIAAPAVMHVAVSNNLIAVQAAGQARLWSRSEHHFAAALPSQGVTAEAFSPDGATLAVGTSTGVLEIWDVAEPEHPTRTRTLPGAAGPIQAIAFSPDDRLLAAGGADHAIRLWNPAVGGVTAPIATISGEAGTVAGLAVSPDGQTLAEASSDGSTSLWDVTRPAVPALVKQIPGSQPIRSVAFDPVGHVLAATGIDGKVRLWSTRNPRSPVALTALDGTGPMAAVAFSPDGRFMAATGINDPGPTQLWDVSDLQNLRLLPTPADGGGNTDVAFSPDGTALVTVDKASGSLRSPDDEVKLWSAMSLEMPAATAALPNNKAYDSVALSPDAAILAAAGVDEVGLWNMADPEHPRELWKQGNADDPTAYTVSLSDRTLAIGGNHTVNLLSLADPSHPVDQGSIILPGSGGFPDALDVTLSPDGRLLEARDRDRPKAWIVDVSTTSRPIILATLNGIPGGHGTFSADGSLLAFDNLRQNQGGTIQGPSSAGIWDIRNPKAPKPLIGAAEQIGTATATQFSPNASVLAVGGPDGSVAFWRTTPGGQVRRVASLPGAGAAVLALRYSADGDFLLAYDTAGTIRMWNVRTPTSPTLLGSYNQPDPAGVSYGDASAAIGSDRPSSGGRTIVTATDISAVYVWTSDADQVIKRLCQTIGDTLTPAQWSQYVPGASYSTPCQGTG
jgi:WD40 repeat protein